MGTFSFFWLPKVFYLGKKGKYGRFFRFVNTWWGNFQNKKAPEYSLFLESRAGIFPIYNQKVGKIYIVFRIYLLIILVFLIIYYVPNYAII